MFAVLKQESETSGWSSDETALFLHHNSNVMSENRLLFCISPPPVA